jgi:hypothetical protein
MKKKLLTILIPLSLILVIGIGIFIFHAKKTASYDLQPTGKPLASTWQLPNNDGIGEAFLYLYKDNTFELMNKDDRRSGSWKFLPNNFLELTFTDKKQKYDLSTNKYFENTKVISPYQLQIKVIEKPAEYLDFFNYFFYKK